MSTTSSGELRCEDDDIALEEFEDAEGTGFECPQCHWVVMASELGTKPTPNAEPKPERRDALLYLATEGERYSPKDLREIDAMRSFAKGQGWVVQGAVIEPQRPTRSAVYSDMIDDFRAGKVDALITWNEELNRPTVWDTEIPGEADWPRGTHLGGVQA